MPNSCSSDIFYKLNFSSEFIELLSQKCMAISKNAERKKLISGGFNFYGKAYGKYIFNKYEYLMGICSNNNKTQPQYDNLKYDKESIDREIIETIIRYDESLAYSKVFRTREEEILRDAEFALFLILAHSECILLTDFDMHGIVASLECFIDKCVDKNNKLLKPAKLIKEKIVSYSDILSTTLFVKVEG